MSTDTRAALEREIRNFVNDLADEGFLVYNDEDEDALVQRFAALARSAPEERGEEEDIGCSMAGRIDVSPGHGSDGTCAVRGGEPCPRACLLRTIGHLRAQVRAAEVSSSYLAARAEERGEGEREDPPEPWLPEPRMIVCPVCGNKRCPHASDSRFVCTGSNEPGQIGVLASPAPSAPEEEP